MVQTYRCVHVSNCCVLRSIHILYAFIFLAAIAALYVVVSVGWSVGRSVGRSVGPLVGLSVPNEFKMFIAQSVCIGSASKCTQSSLRPFLILLSL
jgi:divalent metal cation (Fe/Co/Zn/Cd) transporter